MIADVVFQMLCLSQGFGVLSFEIRTVMNIMLRACGDGFVNVLPGVVLTGGEQTTGAGTGAATGASLTVSPRAFFLGFSFFTV